MKTCFEQLFTGMVGGISLTGRHSRLFLGFSFHSARADRPANGASGAIGSTMPCMNRTGHFRSLSVRRLRKIRPHGPVDHGSLSLTRKWETSPPTNAVDRCFPFYEEIGGSNPSPSQIEKQWKGIIWHGVFGCYSMSVHRLLLKKFKLFTKTWTNPSFWFVANHVLQSF